MRYRRATALFPFLVRDAKPIDIGPMHRIRLAVRENALTHSIICAEDYRHAMLDTGHGWVAEIQGTVRGFAIGNRETGNIWALFVDPGFEGQGIGRRLHEVMVNWLQEQGCERLWLHTDAGTRAERFYRRAGWQYVETGRRGRILLEMVTSGIQTRIQAG